MTKLAAANTPSVLLEDEDGKRFYLASPRNALLETDSEETPVPYIQGGSFRFRPEKLYANNEKE